MSLTPLGLQLFSRRMMLSLGATLIYVVVFAGLYPSLSLIVAALALIPVSVIGCLFGLRGGVVAGLLMTGINLLLFFWVGETGLSNVFMIGSLLIVMSGGVIGRQHDLGEQLKQELAQRKQVETEREKVIAELVEALEALHSSEERFSKAFHASPTIMAISTLKDGCYLDVNESFCRITGYSQEEVIGRTSTEVSIFVNAEDRGRLVQKLKEQGRLCNEEAAILVMSGEVRSGLFSAELIEIEGEQCLLTVMDDITERRQAEEERLKLKKLESVGVLAGGIAHDFNNLLTGLFGNIEMAKMFLSDDHKAHKFLEAAERSMESATNLTNQLLTFAKGGDPIKETLSIGELIIGTAQFSLRGSSAKLQTNITPDLWLVEADKGQLNQVIINLVINAQQAMPAGGIITIAAKNVKTTEGRYVQITVQDEGVGIAPQYLDKIFDPYFSTKQKGSGLGLASTHSIISKHNGRITVDSQLNQGTIFSIHLPATEKTEEKTAKKPQTETFTSAVFSARILVMDDEEIIREVIGTMLGRLGYQVSFAADGQEVITKYRISYENDASYDVVITDLTIPGGMGGQVAAQEILKINPQAKIIVSSGYATNPVMANYKMYGFKGIAVKPYRIGDLQKVIQQVLEM